jgi:hypothetical protein
LIVSCWPLTPPSVTSGFCLRVASSASSLITNLSSPPCFACRRPGPHASSATSRI